MNRSNEVVTDHHALGIAAALPRALRLRGGDGLRRFVEVAESILARRKSLALAIAAGPERAVALADRLLPPASAPSSVATARELRARILELGLPEPRVWCGLEADAEGEQVRFRRSLARALVIVFVEDELRAEIGPLFRCAGLASRVPMDGAIRIVLLRTAPRYPPVSGAALEGTVIESSSQGGL